MAKAFAAVQPNNFFHLLSHDLRPSRWRSSGSSRTLAQESDERNSAVSSDQRPPTGRLRGGATNPPPLPVVCHPCGRAVPNPCRARNVDADSCSALPAHSPRQTPTPNLCALNTPAVAQAERWWPKASSRRPHRQLRTDTGRADEVCGEGARRRGAGSSLELRSEVLVNTTLASGPRCDLIMACSGSLNLGETTWLWSRMLPAFCCHPVRG